MTKALKSKKVETLIERIQSKLPQDNSGSLTAFTQKYYARTPDEDLAALDEEDLYGALLSHWRLGKNRPAGETRVRVYNPVQDDDGWRSLHSIVEIVVDDSPFLVDSVSLALVNHGLNIHLIVHPTYGVERDAAGEVTKIETLPGNKKLQTEAWMHFEVDQISDDADLQQLKEKIESVLSDVRVVVEDWQLMRKAMDNAIAVSRDSSSHAENPQAWDEQIKFLEWLNNHNFTYIGYREFDLVERDGNLMLTEVTESELGIFKLRHSQPEQQIPAYLREHALSVDLLILTKSNSRSTVHRNAQLDYVGVKKLDTNGKVVGEFRFQGLYSSAAYDARPTGIPLLRTKVASIVESSHSSVLSHAGKALEHILHKIPRDVLIQSGTAQLAEMANGILNIQDRPRLKLFVQPDPYKRFIIALLLIPRDHYDTALRLRIQNLLLEVFEGEDVEFSVDFTESVHAQVHFTIRTREGAKYIYDVAELEAQISDMMLSWQDKLRMELLDEFGESEGLRHFNAFAALFPPGYRSDFSPRNAVTDILRIGQLTDAAPLSMHLSQRPENGELQFRIIGKGRMLTLSQAMPWLENMGLRVQTATPYEICTADQSCWVLNVDIEIAADTDVAVSEIRETFQEAFSHVSSGALESDGFNALVLLAGLNWEEIRLIRAICKYLLQTESPFSQSYMEQTLTGNAAISRLLVDYFRIRFDPQKAVDEGAIEAAKKACESAIEGVSSLDEDRILRHFLAVIGAMVRSNYYQREADGEAKSYLSFKLDSNQVPSLPLPLPFREIFVYAPFVEGIHLRGGKVARGGLRWSDRREDFRTEVLGLMKAQMVKNSLIVPVGAKGGFIAKQLAPSGSRDAVMEEVKRCYRTFIRGLLDLTDNRVEGEIVPPADLRRHDEDDPYLVVAADKGTATFSDIANGIAEEYEFWLGDAFASGGSYGYDHKKMGITARGAWESVKRHFRESNVDTQSQTFRVVGIGDMSGDVFGNGMLLSEQIQLVAAFNHMHIFIDPSPDAASSFAERKRLFELPRSSWTDYDASLISSGGGIYPRSAKSIDLSDEACQALQLPGAKLTPNELIQAILRSPVDLLWNGGIGTYVKSTEETHTDVGDRVNDALRINANELCCKVVGEGGNLGFTQLARIEYAAQGGFVYADAVDNSAGVDCSDHEVNIKILLNQLVKDGDMTMKQRNKLLEVMTDEVGDLVLRNNYLQTQLISITANQAGYFLFDHKQLMNLLEQEGLLNREIEFLPSEEELVEREKNGKGLTRPEISVLVSYSKMRLYRRLLESDIRNSNELKHALFDYFPDTLHEQFMQQIETHSLAGEILSTHIANEIIDRMGGSFVMRMEQETGANTADIVFAFWAVKSIFELQQAWDDIEALDNQVSNALQIELFIETRRLADRASRWLLRHLTSPLGIEETVTRFRDTAATVRENFMELAPADARQTVSTRLQHYLDGGVPESLANHIAVLNQLVSVLDIAQVAGITSADGQDVAQVYFSLDKLLDLDWLNHRLRELPRNDQWKRSMRSSLRESVNDTRRDLTAQILGNSGAEESASAAAQLQNWVEMHHQSFNRYRSVLDDIKAAPRVETAMLLVASDALKQLARSEGTSSL